MKLQVSSWGYAGTAGPGSAGLPIVLPRQREHFLFHCPRRKPEFIQLLIGPRGWPCSMPIAWANPGDLALGRSPPGPLLSQEPLLSSPWAPPLLAHERVSREGSGAIAYRLAISLWHSAVLSVLPAPGLVKGCYRVDCILHVSFFTSYVVHGAKKVLNTIYSEDQL